MSWRMVMNLRTMMVFKKRCNDKKQKEYEGIANGDKKEVEYSNETKLTFYGLKRWINKRKIIKSRHLTFM